MIVEEFLDYVADMDDPREEAKVLYPMEEMLLVGISTVICGGEGWQDMSLFGETKLRFLRTILPFKNGIASPYTFEKFFSSLDPKHFEECLVEWVESKRDEKEEGKAMSIAIDGKTVRGSRDKSKGKTAIHLVSAYCRENGLVLGQEKVDDKSNEIKAIPALLEMVNIKGSTITIDAMGCQKNIVEKVIEKGANYVLSLKGNHGGMHKEVKRFFSRHKEQDYKGMGYNFEHYEDIEKGHGRIEKRNITILNQVKWMNDEDLWSGLSSVAMVETTVLKDNKETTETRYFISSLKTTPQHMLELIRGHWAIESMHYILDVTFKEDSCRVRQKNADRNLATFRRVALNLLKTSDIPRKSIKSLRKHAGWENPVLKKILAL